MLKLVGIFGWVSVKLCKEYLNIATFKIFEQSNILMYWPPSYIIIYIVYV